MSKNRRPATRPTSTRTGRPAAIMSARASGSRAQAEMLGHQVFRARRQDGQRDARLLVEQGRDGAVAADGDQAATARVAGGLAHERAIAPRGSRRSARSTPLAARL